MSTKITVIGAGPGGYAAAVRASQLGAEVTIIERENVGGTCLNSGCIPSKIMITTAKLLDKFKRSKELGININNPPAPDVGRIILRKQNVIQTQTKGILSLLKQHNVTRLKGKGVIDRPGLIKVYGTDGSTIEVKWDRLIIATGTKPLEISQLPFDNDRIISSDDALKLTQIPKSMLILGGGVIGSEFACMMSAFGSKVTLVEALSRLIPLPSVDEDCSKILLREMKKRKIDLFLGQTVKEVDSIGTELNISIVPASSDKNMNDPEVITVTAEKILVCVGRRPNTDGIGLNKIGVKLDKAGWVIADENMQTSIPGIYAVGDVLGPSRIMLAHVATAEGIVATENALGKNRAMEYHTIPTAIFTMPEIACVGLTQAIALEKGLDVRADSVWMRSLGRPHITGDLAGQLKIVSDVNTGRILGVHITGSHATELIAEGTLAVSTGRTVKEIADTVHAHPTFAEIMMEASLKADGRPLHG